MPCRMRSGMSWISIPRRWPQRLRTVRGCLAASASPPRKSTGSCCKFHPALRRWAQARHHPGPDFPASKIVTGKADAFAPPSRFAADEFNSGLLKGKDDRGHGRCLGVHVPALDVRNGGCRNDGPIGQPCPGPAEKATGGTDLAGRDNHPADKRGTAPVSATTT
jgi:hypothetical protein